MQKSPQEFFLNFLSGFGYYKKITGIIILKVNLTVQNALAEEREPILEPESVKVWICL